MNNFISKEEAFKILDITSYRQLKRIVDRNNVSTKSLGIGKATLYNKTDICNAVVNTVETKKHAPKKTQQAARQKEKEIKEKKEVETKKLNSAKKEINSKNKKPLNETGQDEYLRIEKELKDKGLYLDTDRAYLLVYAIAYQNYMYYVDLSSSLDHVEIDERGNQKIHPYFTIADKFFNQMEKAASKLGIGARNRIGLEIKKEKTGAMADILSRRAS